MPPKNKITGTNTPKSGRYQFNYELENPIEPAQSYNYAVRGGSDKFSGLFNATYKGGQNMINTRGEVQDADEGIKMLAGKKKYGGLQMAQNLTESKQTFSQQVPPRQAEEINEVKIHGAGLFSIIGNAIDSLVGGGKKLTKKQKESIFSEVEKKYPKKSHEANFWKMNDKSKHRPFIKNLVDRVEKKADNDMSGAGLFSMIGNALDSVGDMVGLGRKLSSEEKQKAFKAIEQKHADVIYGSGFWSDFADGFKKGFTGTAKIALPVLKTLLPIIGGPVGAVGSAGLSAIGLGKKRGGTIQNNFEDDAPEFNAGGIFSDIGSAIGLGKKRGGTIQNNFEDDAPEFNAGGIFSDIGEGLDDIVPFLGGKQTSMMNAIEKIQNAVSGLKYINPDATLGAGKKRAVRRNIRLSIKQLNELKKMI